MQNQVAPAQISGKNKRMSNGTTNVALRQAVKNLDVLPAMPVNAQRLLALKLDTEDGIHQLFVLIEEDPQISAKLIGLANSAALGVTRHIATVRDAAMLLGIKRVQSIATSIAIMSQMAKAPPGRFNMQDLWLHSIGIAFAMLGVSRFMPAKLRPRDDQIFLAGMLHDIGYLVLAYLDSSRSDKLQARLAAEKDRPSLEVEWETLEMCHDELGAELAKHWNLPEEIVAVLRYHHTPDLPEAAAGQPLVRMINVVEKLLPAFGLNEYVASGISTKEWEALGIPASQASQVEEQVDEEAEQAIQFVSSFS